MDSPTKDEIAQRRALEIKVLSIWAFVLAMPFLAVEALANLSPTAIHAVSETLHSYGLDAFWINMPRDMAEVARVNPAAPAPFHVEMVLSFYTAVLSGLAVGSRVRLNPDFGGPNDPEAGTGRAPKAVFVALTILIVGWLAYAVFFSPLDGSGRYMIFVKPGRAYGAPFFLLEMIWLVAIAYGSTVVALGTRVILRRS